MGAWEQYDSSSPSPLLPHPLRFTIAFPVFLISRVPALIFVLLNISYFWGYNTDPAFNDCLSRLYRTDKYGVVLIYFLCTSMSVVLPNITPYLLGDAIDMNEVETARSKMAYRVSQGPDRFCSPSLSDL